MENNNIGITFGIITDGKTDPRVNKIIDAIQTNNIPKNLYQIIIVGGHEREFNRENSIIIPFDETLRKKPWITRKKNLITQQTSFDYIVFSHDYVSYPKDWYENWNKFTQKNDYDIYMNKVFFTNKKQRAGDWVCTRSYLDYHTCNVKYDAKKVYIQAHKKYKMGKLNYGNETIDCAFFLPYDRPYSKFQIIPGNWWVATKKIMQQCPLDQELTWGGMQDNKFSLDTIHSGKATAKMDINNYVFYNKSKPQWDGFKLGYVVDWPDEWD